MALFQSGKNKKAKEIVESTRDLSWVLQNPRLTEKSARLSEGRAYTFVVSTRATKRDIMQAVEQIYKVSPIKVSIIQIPSKSVARRGIKGTKSGGKKAVVYLAEGSVIEFV
jgi:large subunit ribosomal protein L23